MKSIHREERIVSDNPLISRSSEDSVVRMPKVHALCACAHACVRDRDRKRMKVYACFKNFKHLKLLVIFL